MRIALKIFKIIFKILLFIIVAVVIFYSVYNYQGLKMESFKIQEDFIKIEGDKNINKLMVFTKTGYLYLYDEEGKFQKISSDKKIISAAGNHSDNHESVYMVFEDGTVGVCDISENLISSITLIDGINSAKEISSSEKGFITVLMQSDVLYHFSSEDITQINIYNLEEYGITDVNKFKVHNIENTFLILTQNNEFIYLSFDDNKNVLSFSSRENIEDFIFNSPVFIIRDHDRRVWKSTYDYFSSEPDYILQSDIKSWDSMRSDNYVSVSNEGKLDLRAANRYWGQFLFPQEYVIFINNLYKVDELYACDGRIFVRQGNKITVIR